METFRLGGDLEVNRLGFGAMRLCGPGISGWPADRENALRVLRRAVELGANLVDTADAYGRSPVTIPIPGTSSLEHLKENMGARELELTDAELDRLR